jgi:uncharacterized protein DUF4349
MTTLDELAIALAAEAPQPGEDFARRLDARVAAGFPRKRALPKLPPLAVFGGVTAAAVAVIVAVTLVGNSGTSMKSSAASKAASDTKLNVGKELSGRSAGVTAQAAPALKAAPAPAPARQTPRHVERSASLTLAATRGKLESVANQVVGVVDQHHGYVLHSSVTSGAGGGGSFDLRVPVGQLQATIADLSRLADVRSRSQNLNDVTTTYNATQDRLATQRALRQSLLKQLAAATSQSQADAIRQRLRLVTADIRSLSATFDNLRQHTAYASIAVQLVPKRAEPVTTEGGLGGDFHDALHSLVVSFGIALRVLGVAIPLGIVAALGWFGWTALQRRRREAALS